MSARLVDKIEAVLASAVVRKVSAVASSKVAHAVATAAEAGIAGGIREPATAEQRVAAFDAALEFDDWCGTPWPHHWPKPKSLGELGDPIAEVVIGRALDLVRQGGSEELQKTLGSTLAELSPARG